MRDSLRWVPLDSAGGFSGARIWRGEADGVPRFALKAWPQSFAPSRLASIHAWMEGAAQLPFVPFVFRTDAGTSFAVEDGRVWDLTSWKPGTADFHANPSAERLANACAALAELHRVWKPTAPGKMTCPAILRRLQALNDWKAHRSAFAAVREPLLQRAVEVVTRLAVPAEQALLRYPMPVSVQPCLCDVWHDHVLFTGDAVGFASRSKHRGEPETNTSPPALRGRGRDADANASASRVRGLSLVSPGRPPSPGAEVAFATSTPTSPPSEHGGEVKAASLFTSEVTGDAVSGIVDYGAMKLDHVAIDLARMLGDFVGEDEARFERGLAAYREAGGVLEVPGEFVRLLDRTGVVCGIVGWLLRLHVEKRFYPDPRAVAHRLERLVSRGESIRRF